MFSLAIARRRIAAFTLATLVFTPALEAAGRYRPKAFSTCSRRSQSCNQRTRTCNRRGCRSCAQRRARRPVVRQPVRRQPIVRQPAPRPRTYQPDPRAYQQLAQLQARQMAMLARVMERMEALERRMAQLQDRRPPQAPSAPATSTTSPPQNQPAPKPLTPAHPIPNVARAPMGSFNPYGIPMSAPAPASPSTPTPAPTPVAQAPVTPAPAPPASLAVESTGRPGQPGFLARVASRLEALYEKLDGRTQPPRDQVFRRRTALRILQQGARVEQSFASRPEHLLADRIQAANLPEPKDAELIVAGSLARHQRYVLNEAWIDLMRGRREFRDAGATVHQSFPSGKKLVLSAANLVKPVDEQLRQDAQYLGVTELVKSIVSRLRVLPQ